MVGKLTAGLAAFIGLQCLGQFVLFDLIWMAIAAPAAATLWWVWASLQVLLAAGLLLWVIHRLQTDRSDSREPTHHAGTEDDSTLTTTPQAA